MRELRERVGSEFPLWFPGVIAVVLDGDGRVLLHRRADNGRWAMISGILDPGEEPATGVVREVWEETGVRVVPESLTSVTVSPPVVHANGDHARYLELTFRCRAVGGHARVNDDESAEVGWFSRHALPPLAPGYRTRIDHALDERATAWFAGPETD